MENLNPSKKPPRNHSSRFLPLLQSNKSSNLNEIPRAPSISSLNTSFKSDNSRVSSTSLRRRRYYSLSNIPKTTSSAWTVVEKNTGAVLHSHNPSDQREIASLTKIMTCILSLNLASQFNLSLTDTKIKISYSSAKMIGTSANLKVGDQIYLKSLLHGLMLPSGNDAAWALAEFFGEKLLKNSGKRVKRFVQEMNKTASSLDMNGTLFANPHGLMENRNLSCAKDVAKLAVYALKNEVFKNIVNCKVYTAQVVGEDGCVRDIVWENTNKLLGKGFDGVKTGVTAGAGPCLCACTSSELKVVIVLLNSENMESRWVEAKKLARWASLKFS